MVDENGTEVEAAEKPGEPQAGPAPEEPDYKALYEAERKSSRKWEGCAKENGESVAAARAEVDYLNAVVSVAASTGMPVEAVKALRGTTAEELAASAEAIKAAVPGPSYPESRDKGEVRAPAMTREQILAIRDPAKRVDAIAQHRDLFEHRQIGA